MEGLMDSLGRLEFVVARGWMSPYEAGILKLGDVVLSSGTAGTDGELVFNGEFLASAWAVISGSYPDGSRPYFGARLHSFSHPQSLQGSPELGPALTDLLPFALVAAGMDVRLKDIELCGPGSLLRFDTPYSLPSSVELRVLGIPLGRGQMVVKGELYGLKLTELFTSAFESAEPRLSGALLSAHAAQGAKIYDFSRPDAVTFMTIHALEDISRRFIASLSVRFPGLEGYELLSVDQMTAQEWEEFSPCAGRRLALAQAGRRGRDYEGDSAAEISLQIVEGPHHPEPLDAESRARALESLSTWKRFEHQGPVALKFPRAAAFDAAGFFACLRSSWNQVADLAFREAREENELNLAQPSERGFHPQDMVLTASFSKPGAQGIDIAYSLRALSAQLETLDRHGRAHARP